MLFEEVLLFDARGLLSKCVSAACLPCIHGTENTCFHLIH